MKKLLVAVMVITALGALGFSSAEAYPTYGSNCGSCHPGEAVLPPTAAAGPDQNVAAGASVSLSGSASTDQDDGIASYAWKQTAGPSVTLTGAGTVSATFKAPSSSTASTLTFQLTVKDRGGATGTDTCIVNVAAVVADNVPPVANAGVDRTVAEGTAVTLNGSGSSDSDGAIASYAWTQTGGTAVTLNGAANANATFTAPAGSASLTFKLTVTDDQGAQASDTVIVNVSGSGQVNTPPTAKAGMDKNVNSGTTVTLNGSNSIDSDGSIVSYQWRQISGPTVTVANAGQAAATFKAPLGGVNGVSLTFRLTVTDDGGLKATDTCIVNVNPQVAGNRAPVARAGTDRIVRGGVVVRLNGTNSSDPNKNIASYSWRQISGPAVMLRNANTAQPTFRSPVREERASFLTFKLTVTDEGGLKSSDTVTIRVRPVDDDDDDD